MASKLTEMKFTGISGPNVGFGCENKVLSRQKLKNKILYFMTKKLAFLKLVKKSLIQMK
jgi:hypothetical protein